MHLHFPEYEDPLPELAVFYKDFLNSRILELNDLTHELELDDLIHLLNMAHKWKGFSMPYGFGELVYFAIELENEAHNAAYKRCEEILKDILMYLEYKKNSRFFR